MHTTLRHPVLEIFIIGDERKSTFTTKIFYDIDFAVYFAVYLPKQVSWGGVQGPGPFASPLPFQDRPQGGGGAESKHGIQMLGLS